MAETISRIGTVIAFSVVGALLLLALSSSIARAVVDAPMWSPGNSWQWQSSDYPGPTLLTLQILGQEPLDVSGIPDTAFHARLWNNFTDGPAGSNATGDLWYRVSDLAVLESVIRFNLSANGSARYTTTAAYSTPLPLHFPLVTNDTWQATTTVTMVTTSPGQPTSWENLTETVAGHVFAPLGYTVTAGTFTTIPIRETWGSGYGSYAETRYWSSEVGNSVNGPFTGWIAFSQNAQLVSYHYTPAPSANPGFLSQPILMLVVGVTVGVAAGGSIVFLLLRHRSQTPTIPAHKTGPDRPGPPS